MKSGDDISTATALAKEADVAIVVLAQSSTEGHDRQYLNLSQVRAIVCHSAAQCSAAQCVCVLSLVGVSPRGLPAVTCICMPVCVRYLYLT